MRDPSANRPEIKALTSLRGVAAMAVVLQHFSATAQSHAAETIPSLAPHGYIAVDFFFVLSGFIMAYTYLDGFETRGASAYLPFLWKRVARIFPLGIAVTAAVLLLGGIAALWGKPQLFLNEAALEAGLGKAVLVNVLHVQLFFNRFSLNDAAWSISAEFVAYLLFPLLLFIIFRGPRWGAALYGLAGIGVLLLIALSQDGSLIFRVNGATDLIRCLAEFGFGLILYRAYRSRSALCRIGSDRWTWFVSACCLVFIVLRIDPLTTLSFPFVVLAFALNRGAPSRLLSTAVPYFLGMISFSIYLVHHMFRAPELALVTYLHPAPLPTPAALLFAFVGSMTVLPFAALAYFGIERPGRSALNSIVRKFSRRQAAQTAGVRPRS